MYRTKIYWSLKGCTWKNILVLISDSTLPQFVVELPTHPLTGNWEMWEPLNIRYILLRLLVACSIWQTFEWQWQAYQRIPIRNSLSQEQRTWRTCYKRCFWLEISNACNAYPQRNWSIQNLWEHIVRPGSLQTWVQNGRICRDWMTLSKIWNYTFPTSLSLHQHCMNLLMSISKVCIRGAVQRQGRGRDARKTHAVANLFAHSILTSVQKWGWVQSTPTRLESPTLEPALIVLMKKWTVDSRARLVSWCVVCANELIVYG